MQRSLQSWSSQPCATETPQWDRWRYGPILSRMASSTAYSPAAGPSFSTSVITGPAVVVAHTLIRAYDTDAATSDGDQGHRGQRFSTVGFSRRVPGRPRASGMCRREAHRQISRNRSDIPGVLQAATPTECLVGTSSILWPSLTCRLRWRFLSG